MKIILVFIISLVLAFSAHAQQPFICTLSEFPSGQPSPPTAPPGVCSIDFSTYDVSAPFTIYVNLFFMDGSIGANFTPDSARLIGHQLIDIANSQLAGMGISNRSGPGGVISPEIPNAKWKYEIYTEGLQGDDLGGIWVGNNPNSNMYLGKVLNINITNDANVAPGGQPPCWSGSAGLGSLSSITLNGVYSCHNEFWGLGVYARTLNHEIGHALGLEHVTFCNNQCRFEDVDPEAHCGPNCPSLVTCDLDNPTKIICTTNMPPDTIDRCKWDFSNNLMSQGVNLQPWTNTRLPDALTPCQWELAQNKILNSPTQAVSWADNCQEIDTDYSIPSGTTVTWASLVNINRNIIVEKGATLNINCEVRFAQGTGIIVRQGGTLNVNEAKLTNLCKEMPWNGIRVEGDPSQSQYTPGKHGRAYIKPGSIVENAKEAVRLVGGGIVFTNGTTYMNNGTGIIYRPYSNFWPFGSQAGQPRDHLGYVQNCSFVWNDGFAGAPDINAGVEMQGVRGIKISGCSFENTRPISVPQGYHDYGYGVKATDALFSVASLALGPVGPVGTPPSAYDHSVFKGLGYGIYAASADLDTTFSSVPYRVENATFTECIHGIHNRFVSQGLIVGNTFNMGKLPAVGGIPGNLPFTNRQVGVFIEDGSNGFVLEQNTFSRVNGNVTLSYGSYADNLGRFNNVIRKNTYSNVNVGNFAERINAGPQTTTPSGLHYLCNINTTQNYDFFVDSLASVRVNQAFEFNTQVFAAGNVFTKANSPTGDFNNFGTKVRYFRNQTSEEPAYYLGLFPFDFGLPNSCQDNYCLPPCLDNSGWEGLKQTYDIKRNLYIGTLSDLQAATASGNDALAAQKSSLAAGYRREMDEAANMVAVHMAYDTSTYNRDSLRTWWQKMDSPLSDLVAARDYLALGQNTQAFAVIDAMPPKFGLTAIEAADITAFRSVMTVMQGKKAATLSPSDIQTLLAHANADAGASSAWARNILTLRGFHFHPEPKPFWRPGEREMPSVHKPAKLPDAYVVAPNPARDWVYFQRQAATPEDEQITVSDANGSVVWRSSMPTGGSSAAWLIGDLPGGIYFYAVRGASGTVQSGRVSIIK